jgi:Leucine-rich repeat (LRR) protein
MITEMFTTEQEIKDFLKECGVFQKNYKIHEDLTVEILNDELDLSYADIKIIPFKFIGVKDLIISYTQIEIFEGLPEGLEKLWAYKTPLKSTKGLSSSLKFLDISDTLVEYLENLPEGLERLYA